MTHPDEGPGIAADLRGSLTLPSGHVYEVGLGELINENGEADRGSLPEGPWRVIHLRLKGRSAWLKGYSSGFLFRVGQSVRPDAGSDLFPALTSEHVRRILEMAGVPDGTAVG